ncbi:MAG TPA: hypothetical protein VKV73_26720 [Chloroflexota bacterium]|nr:hypothetical protein [Chloroflexota bacterium]
MAGPLARIRVSVSRLVDGLGDPSTQQCSPAPGKAADVLIVEGARDRDIRALRRPRLVIAAGRLVQPTPPPAWPGPFEW